MRTFAAAKFTTLCCRRKSRCLVFCLHHKQLQIYSLLFRSKFPIFPPQLPSLGELESRRYYISMSSSEGHTFLNRQFVSFFGESNGHMLVKTDKPIYKPAQTGRFTIHI